MKLGKRAPRAAERTLKLAAYLPPDLPPAPIACDWSARVTGWGPMGNLEIGDCTCAAAGHAIQVWTANTGTQRIPSDADVLALYSATSGYVAGNPLSDRGAYISDVLTRWSTSGLGGDVLTAAAKVDATELEHVKRTIALFGCADIGLELPAFAMAVPADQPWDVVADDGGPAGGHCVLAVAYDLDGLTVVTWGQLRRMTWAFFGAYTDECWALVSRDFVGSAGTAPDGLDLDQMSADLAALKSATS